MTKSVGIRLAGLTAGILLSLLFLLGCSELPNQPVSDGFTIEDFAAMAAQPDVFRLDVPETEASVISAEDGGSIEIPIQRGASAIFEVPAKSISEDTEITILVRPIDVRGKTILDFTFGPSGLVFEKEATLTIDVGAFNDPDMEYVEWYYYNPDKRVFELEYTATVDRGQVVIPISHFSRYIGISQGGE
jgi:hypothetical protein